MTISLPKGTRSPHRKLTLEERRALEKLLMVRCETSIILQRLKITPQFLVSEKKKGMTDKGYSAELAHQIAGRPIFRRREQSPLNYLKKDLLKKAIKKGCTMVYLCNITFSCPQRVYQFMEETGLTAGYEEWKDWEPKSAMTTRKPDDGEDRPFTPREYRLQIRIDSLEEENSSLRAVLKQMEEDCSHETL